MKEIFIQQRDEEISNMSDAEYQDWLKNEAPLIPQEADCCGGDCHCEGESVTQEDSQSNHDAWWASLTDEQKQQLYNDKEKAFELSVEEMNHDLNFGK